MADLLQRNYHVIRSLARALLKAQSSPEKTGSAMVIVF
jgi:hypothetical protein